MKLEPSSKFSERRRRSVGRDARGGNQSRGRPGCNSDHQTTSPPATSAEQSRTMLLQEFSHSQSICGRVQMRARYLDPARFQQWRRAKQRDAARLGQLAVNLGAHAPDLTQIPPLSIPMAGICLDHIPSWRNLAQALPQSDSASIRAPPGRRHLQTLRYGRADLITRYSASILGLLFS
jgi:hypothetical protein